ncbi:transcription factor bHLH25-like [Lotus japonicus]|uniref:transcription factor bHLH25-like n=1 Tax=Lotus japonicus TaxID=34305 RepID=UPI002587C254|nr:transcription factor bHLH25-like [Lotus japonicus]
MDCFACPYDDFDMHSFSTLPDSDSSYQCFNYETTPNFVPAEVSNYSVASAKPTSDMIMPSSSPIPSQLISFNHFNNPALVSQGASEDSIFSNYGNPPNQFAARTPTQTQEHIIAERKRREKLSQNFIALSAILPGLARMDRGSILGVAIMYVKQLQEQVQTLEEQAAKEGVGSALLVKRSVLFISDDSLTKSDKIFDNHCYKSLPEIRVRVSGNDVLIKIHCHKQSGYETIILGEIEKHDHLTVHSFSFLPFGNTIIDATIIAKMNKENCKTSKDIVRSLQQALKQII